MNKAFIVQARLGSTRLPNKIILPFFEGKSLIELLIHKLQAFEGVDVIIATSNSEVDKPLVNLLEGKNVKCFIGSENDVLSRFINAAEYYGIEEIIRICSDNPFLDEESLQVLLDASVQSTADYISFNVGGNPSIRTHFGFWAEYVSLKALKLVSDLTDEYIFHEHVTNFIYSHPELFNVSLINVANEISSRNDVRLTIDTQKDFEISQEIYSALGNHSTIRGILRYIDDNPIYKQSMKQQILKNCK